MKTSSFDYRGRASTSEAARKRIAETFRFVVRRNDVDDPRTKAWLAAVADWRRAQDATYPAGFWEDVKQMNHDFAAREQVIDFLEADPMFFGSGYTKSKVLRRLKHCPLTPKQRARLRSVILSVCEKRNTYEFADYCRLARHLSDPQLRSALERLTASEHLLEGRRARWMLERLEQGVSLKGPPTWRTPAQLL